MDHAMTEAELEAALRPRPPFPRVLGILGMAFAVLGLLVGLATYGSEVSAQVGASLGVTVLHFTAGALTAGYRRVGPILFMLYSLCAVVLGAYMLLADPAKPVRERGHSDYGTEEDWIAALAAVASIAWAVVVLPLAASAHRACSR